MTRAPVVASRGSGAGAVIIGASANPNPRVVFSFASGILSLCGTISFPPLDSPSARPFISLFIDCGNFIPSSCTAICFALRSSSWICNDSKAGGIDSDSPACNVAVDAIAGGGAATVSNHRSVCALAGELGSGVIGAASSRSPSCSIWRM
jgi:hypothetical protein